MGKENNISLEEFNGGRGWISLLDEVGRMGLARIEKSIFGGYLHDGYEIVWAMGVDSGFLLREGPYVGHIQTKTARNQISKMEQKDMFLLSSAALNGRKINSKSSWWWDENFQKKHLPQYIWAEKAVLPPQDWEKLSKLSVDDLKVDNMGITIFVKKDSIAKKSKIFS